MGENMSISFKEHTKEKLESLVNYYEEWSFIVSSQKCYIIDCNAGTGYVNIKDKNQTIFGSALIAINLFKKSYNNKLKIILIEKDIGNFNTLKKNISECILDNNLNVKIDSDIIFYNDDWANIIDDVISSTQDGIRLFFLDPFAIKSLPFHKLNSLIKHGQSFFGYKETGIEVLINWAWHTIRRKIGKYYAYKTDPLKIKGIESELEILDNFFGSVNWKEIVNKYPPNIFKANSRAQIELLRDELILAYVVTICKQFKYVKIHSVYARKKEKKINLVGRGTLKYFLIFASNYQGALDIIDKKFREYRDKIIFEDDQETLLKYFSNSDHKKDDELKISLEDRIRSIELELNDKLYSINKKIIKYLYYRKNYDYGCYDFALFKKFEIDPEHYSIKYLIEKGILNFRKRKDRSNQLRGYYYLSHPKLVDRKDYLFFDNKRYIFKDEKLIEF